MKSVIWITAILLGILISCDRDDENDDRPDNEVWMTASTFQPGNLVVSAGTRVRWVNTSSVAHNVVSDDGLFESHLLAGQDFEYSFNDPGTYGYVCTIHIGMTGTITVE